MTEVRTYEGVPLAVIWHRGQAWFTAADIAAALGYAQSRAVINLYNRNAGEFDARMTCVLDLAEMCDEEGFVIESMKNLPERVKGGGSKVRCFSVRGAHLLGMLADTDPAKAFRVWALDVLEHFASERLTVVLGEPEAVFEERLGSLPEKRRLSASVFQWMEVRARADRMIESLQDALAKGSKRLRDE